MVTTQPVAFVAVLRAGLGMLPGLQHLLPQAHIGHIGLYRNEETLNPVRYYVRLPKNIRDCFVVLCDPMLATGGSAVESLHILKTDKAKQIVLLSLIAAKAGVARVQQEHPDVPIYLAGMDPNLSRCRLHRPRPRRRGRPPLRDLTSALKPFGSRARWRWRRARGRAGPGRLPGPRPAVSMAACSVTTTRAGCRRQEILLFHAKAPEIVTGVTGAPKRWAMRKTPSWNGRRRPSRVRAPSGKTTRLVPELRASWVSFHIRRRSARVLTSGTGTLPARRISQP